jgi:hypothetical protein
MIAMVVGSRRTGCLHRSHLVQTGHQAWFGDSSEERNRCGPRCGSHFRRGCEHREDVRATAGKIVEKVAPVQGVKRPTLTHPLAVQGRESRRREEMRMASQMGELGGIAAGKGV